ncbi:MAG: C-terminal binding protein [Caldilineaceae bacterium SB0661_bin_32]|uniref:C-terminal binding protein n=1 Tax=Caldilineaceae bacterium SB0661_bin_32 TaxID=2605255 RepID=A0A6B1D9D6_9CHLR|nr:C-terminal binding protein [Caldilineaceae bacterium SB0661_bin_32]
MTRFKVAMVHMDPEELPEWVPETMASHDIEFVFQECETRAQLAATAEDADVVWIFGGSHIVTAENVPDLRKCGALIRTGSGTDNIPIEAATAHGIIVANTPEAFNDGVSDHTIALLLAVVRQIALQDRNVRAGTWDRYAGFPGWHLQGQTLGLIGFGHIARLVTRKLSGFEMKVLAHDPFVSAELMADHGVQAASMEQVLSDSDFVSLHCPLLDETHKLIGERELRLMRPQAILINTSRGPVVDEVALFRALTEGWIAAAGLDVLEQEPPNRDNPLFRLDNVVFTPHIAGYSDESLDNSWRFSVETILDLAQGRWPRSYVNPGVKPRWQLQRR